MPHMHFMLDRIRAVRYPVSPMPGKMLVSLPGRGKIAVAVLADAL